MDEVSDRNNGENEKNERCFDSLNKNNLSQDYFGQKSRWSKNVLFRYSANRQLYLANFSCFGVKMADPF